MKQIFYFLEFPCFIYDRVVVGNFISGCSVIPKSSLYICKFSVNMLLKSNLKDLSIALLVCEMSAVVCQFEHSLPLPFFWIGM